MVVQRFTSPVAVETFVLGVKVFPSADAIEEFGHTKR
jgi:hypothetical protein